MSKWLQGSSCAHGHVCVCSLLGHPRRNILYKAGSLQAAWIGVDLSFPVGRKVLWAMRHPHRLLPLTWSDCLQEGRQWFILPDQTSGKVPISVNFGILCFVTRAWAETPQNWIQATGNSFPCFLSCARFNAYSLEDHLWSYQGTGTRSYICIRDCIFPGCRQASGKRHLQVKLTRVLFLSCT